MHTLIKSLQNIVKEGREKGYEESKICIVLNGVITSMRYIWVERRSF